MSTKRRTILKLVGGTVGAVEAAAAGGAGWMHWVSREVRHGYDYPSASGSGAGRSLAATPGCGDVEATEAQTQGPFYTPGTPERSNLREPGMAGVPLAVRGRVLTTDCRPVAGAVLDVWSCDGEGTYDNDGFRLRGHQFTDANGRFLIETVKPSAYGGFGFMRTPHLHIKLQGRDTRLLTTQLYFPGEPLNAEDGIFSEALLMDTREGPDGTIEGRFDFVLAPAVQA